ncbi:MAG TPA: thioesterase family protein [Acidimicrobiales bacterium]|nr:thioesterase family protein [Acidimicrobiales bacterium]
MGDISVDTAVEPVAGGQGRYTARFSRDWQIWGPNGGYLASIALRAAEASTTHARPATFSCVFVGTGNFDDPVDIAVEPIRQTRRAEALRVCIGQAGKPLLEAHVWSVDDDLPGLEHEVVESPDVPGPDGLKSIEELMTEENPARFWSNFETKPITWIPPEEWPPPEPMEPSVRQWMRFRPRSSFEDQPWVDACRSLILLDTFQWPAAHRPHVLRGPDEPAYIAPNIDLSAWFHRSAPTSEWLLVDASSPLATNGLMAGSARVWSEDGKLLASAASHLMCREVPRGTPGSGTAN